MGRKMIWLWLLLAAALTLAACSAGGNTRDWDEHTLVYANLSRNGPDREAIDDFNLAHTDVQIEVRDYYDEDGHSGKDRLMAEIAAGKSPDLIDLGGMAHATTTLLPYRQLAQKGYLEDLWPYIENDPELGRGAVLEAPLKAAEIDGGLYLAFNSVIINTLIGAESVVGDRTSWTLADLRESLASMPEDSTVLTCYFDKSTIFTCLLSMSLDGYVDWERGECDFDSEAFRSALEFINSFPAEVSWASAEALNEKINEQMLSGRQMLIQTYLYYPIEVQSWDDVFGGRASFVGYPVTDGSVGSSFCIHGHRIAMSSSCRNKEAGWDFLRQMFLPQYNRMNLPDTYGQNSIQIPINRADYELVKKRDMDPLKDHGTIHRFGESYEYHATTADEFQRFDDLVNSISKIELCDQAVFDIVKETCGPCFAGDKTLDETVALIQNRVTLYVNENR